MDPADLASDWQRYRLSDGNVLKLPLSFSTGKIVAVLLFYSSFYGATLLSQLVFFYLYSDFGCQRSYKLGSPTPLQQLRLCRI